jgi:hypothetical protein
MHTRYRRFLSADRRGGSQLPADVRDGRTARYAQGWRDINVADDTAEAPGAIIHALVVLFAVWLMVALAVVGAVAVLG